MNIGEMDKGLIYTDSKNCVGCNNCIRECPELTANVTVMEGEFFKTHLANQTGGVTRFVTRDGITTEMA